MTSHADAEHIMRMITSGSVVALPAAVSAEAEQHLIRCFPVHSQVTTSIVRWDEVPSSVLRWSSVNDDDAVRWAASTLAGEHTYGLMFFSSDQPCVLGKFDFMIRHLDELVWRAPGNRLLFGVEVGGDGKIVFSDGIIEFNGRGDLVGSTKVTA